MTNAITEVRTSMEKMRPELAKVLPEHITPERFERVTLTALQRAPDLLNCDRQSLYESCMRCAQDGLIPDGREAALVRFKNNVAYMPMVSGILKKVRQSGQLATITAQVVHEGDDFRYWLDDQGEHLHHEPNLTQDPGDIRCVYAMAKTTEGEVYIEVMRRGEVEQVRAASRAANGGPWSNWWGEMARKTAIRRLSKRLPMSTDLEVVVRRDDQFYDLGEPKSKAAEAVQTYLAKPEESQESVEVYDGQTETMPLYKADGSHAGDYQRVGSWLNAMEKMVERAGDRTEAQAVWKVNASVLDDLGYDGQYCDRVATLSEQVAAKPDSEPPYDEPEADEVF